MCTGDNILYPEDEPTTILHCITSSDSQRHMPKEGIGCSQPHFPLCHPDNRIQGRPSAPSPGNGTEAEGALHFRHSSMTLRGQCLHARPPAHARLFFEPTWDTIHIGTITLFIKRGMLFAKEEKNI